MLPRNHPDRIKIAFDDHRLVANAGLLLPATLEPAPRVFPNWYSSAWTWVYAPGRANTGDKIMTLVLPPRWLNGDQQSTDADAALRAEWDGRCSRPCLVKAPYHDVVHQSCDSFRWGHRSATSWTGVAGREYAWPRMHGQGRSRTRRLHP